MVYMFFEIIRDGKFATLAPTVERLTCNQDVVGSNPSGGYN